MQIAGNVVSPFTGIATPAVVTIRDGRIAAIAPSSEKFTTFLLPGFVDAHVHIESSMLVPSEFARIAVTHGTVATVSDPHEIANVLGVTGIRFMVKNARQVPFTFCFGAPACVPATEFETAGAVISANDIEELFESNDCQYLSEVMNFPGVLAGDRELMAKLAAARHRHKRIDGHAPGLRGEKAARYFAAEHGISTDHECVTLAEAHDKIARGASILIREGSAAKNYEALCDLLETHPDRVMFCSDDKHPDDLLAGHINLLVTRALSCQVPLANVLRAACVNPVQHYGLDVGLLRVGDSADFIETDSLTDLSTQRIRRTFISGQLVAENGRSLIPHVPIDAPNVFAGGFRNPSEFAVPAVGNRMRVVAAEDGQLITNVQWQSPRIVDKHAVADLDRDLLKITVVNRYLADSPRPAVAFIHGFGLKRGAIASSVAHDSHNIVAVGVDDESLARAINLVIANRGGLAATDGDTDRVLPLPVAGLMSTDSAETVGHKYSALQHMATHILGSTLKAPFMTLSFMALLVIPNLKLSDKGLFDAENFRPTTLFETGNSAAP
jgi:adenine deaminase